MRRKEIPAEALINLRERLALLPSRSPNRKIILSKVASLYGVSASSIYRKLREFQTPKAIYRKDKGKPRSIPEDQLHRYCEIIAAFKIRTMNKQGRHMSTQTIIRLLEEQGVQTNDGFVKPAPGLLKKATVNRYLKQWNLGLDQLSRQPAAIRFEAQHSNDCWHFDLSPSDLKKVAHPAAENIDPDKGHPVLMLYSVVDDKSGVAYHEYHGVYGEDVEAALRFLFNAMSLKSDSDFPFQGIPKIIYADNGPVSRSLIFRRVLDLLGIELRTHMPKDSDGRRVTARSKGKVERPFRTVKEMFETLFHLQKPETEKEANEGLLKYLQLYNSRPHRSENHSRMEDWLENLPKGGFRQMCNWERFCTFAREPERRKVGIDARVSIDGVSYEVDLNLVGETVMLWWGLFDNELYVELDDKSYGPYQPVGGPIPLNHYRKPKKTATQKRADRIEKLARQLKLPKEIFGTDEGVPNPNPVQLKGIPFNDPDPFETLRYPDLLTAKKEIAGLLGMPLAKLPSELLDQINAFLGKTLSKSKVQTFIYQDIQPALRKEPRC